MADRALYEAKHSGRNQAVGALPAEEEAELVGAPANGAAQGRAGKSDVRSYVFEDAGDCAAWGELKIFELPA